MSYEIETRVDRKRGCGWRKEGGLYLVSGGEPVACDRLPIPLNVCPTCGGGIKPARSWTWVNATAIFKESPCSRPPTECCLCPLSKPLGRAGLLWIGGAYYRRPEDFSREAAEQGVSRRITAIPKGFTVGETWVLLAHREAVINPDDSKSAGVFCAFKPSRIEYVVKADDTPEKLQRLADRGVTLIRVERAGETKDLFEQEPQSNG